MMYDELVKNLRDCSEVNSLSRYKRGLMKQAADAIEKLWELFRSAEKDNAKLTAWYVEKCNKHKWIPVTERLPEKHIRVLLYAKLSPKRDYIGVDYINADENWYTTPNVTHWMPLPEPPKDGEA